VLLSYDDSLTFQSENFRCRHCHSPLSRNKFEKIQLTFATSFNYDCSYKRTFSLETQTKRNPQKDAKFKFLQSRAVPHLVSDYSINNAMVLSMQQLGCGQTGAAVVGGMLSITPNAFHNTWTDMEVAIGKVQVKVGKNILKENVEKGKTKTTCQFCGKVGHKTRRSKHCTFTTKKPETEKGKNHQFHVMT
jgi:hypothetical protein